MCIISSGCISHTHTHLISDTFHCSTLRLIEGFIIRFLGVFLTEEKVKSVEEAVEIDNM